MPIELRFAAPPRLAAVQGMTAKVEISDVGTFDLTVAADGSASGEIRDVPVGSRKTTIRYYKDATVLAEVSRSLDLAVGQRVEVKITPADFKFPDTDGNGVSNFDEILALNASTVSTANLPTTGSASPGSESTPGSAVPVTAEAVDASNAPKLVVAELKILAVNGRPPESAKFRIGGLAQFTIDLIVRNDGAKKATGVRGLISAEAIDLDFPIGSQDDCLRKGDYGNWDNLTYPDIGPGQSSGANSFSSGAGGYQFYLSSSCSPGTKTLYVLLSSREGAWSSSLTILMESK